MKKIFYGLLTAFTLAASGCSSSKITADNFVKNSIWVNLTPSEMNNEKATIINSIYFTKDNKYILKTGVGQDSTILVAPIFSEYGTYSCSGSLKKGIMIQLNTDVSTFGKITEMNGVITNEGMLLISPDSTESFFFKLQTEKNSQKL